MECSRTVGLMVIMMVTLACCVPTDIASTRSTASPIGDIIKQLTNQLMALNTTTADITLDVRTPPKIKQQQQMNHRNKFKSAIENSHAGIAIPVDEDSIELEETTKKLSFYKIERPTTNSGLSTWILLSGQSSSTVKPTKKLTLKPSFEPLKSTTNKPLSNKPVISDTKESSNSKPFEKIKPSANITKLSSKPSAVNETTKQNPNITVIHENKPPRIVKPIFKKRSTTTIKPSTTTTPKYEKESTTKNNTLTSNKNANKVTKLNKVKASILNNALNKKNTTNSGNKKQGSSTIKTNNNTMETSTVIATGNNSSVNNSGSAALPLEAKEGETELSATTASSTEKKKKHKRKKNKNRRRKPSDNTKLDQTDDKPISTQIYSYLSREIMPTVGVGLVGLMVTAGLASYFLYPFGPLRRNYIVDRKDNAGGYFYNDDHSGGMLEEEAIGKVIAGMSSNSYQTNTHKSPASRNVYPSNNVRYRNVDRKGDAQSSYNTNDQPVQAQNSISPSTYGRDSYVVGSVSKDVLEESTPVAVPEHGPRKLDVLQTEEKQRFVVGNIPKEFQTAEAAPISSTKIRKPRDVPIQNELDNEIEPNEHIFLEHSTESIKDRNDSVSTENVSTTTEVINENKGSFLDAIKDLFHFKLRIGLQLVQNVTRSVSSYISGVQMRLDEYYRNRSKEKTH